MERLLNLVDQKSQHCSKHGWNNTLIGNGLELAWRIDELSSDLVGKLDYSNEVAYTKAHCDISLLVTLHKVESDNRGSHRIQATEHVVGVQPHEAEFCAPQADLTLQVPRRTCMWGFD
jgi:hypothetical protein